MKHIINLVSFFILNLILLPVISFADIIEPMSGINVTDFISQILDYVVKIGGILVALAFVYTGYSFASARGDSGQLDNAKNILIKTIIGSIILLGAKVIGVMILSFLDKFI